jgi:hypothetical protein
MAKLLPQRTTWAFGSIFSLIDSNLHLPRRWNAIILHHKVGISPVGARPFVKRELSP